MIEAYAIGMSLTLNQAPVIGPLGEILAAMAKVQKAIDDTQIGINSMVASLRGAGRVANTFADAMERAAAASMRFRAPGVDAAAAGAGFGGGPAGPSGYVGPAYLLSSPPPRFALPSTGPQLLLGGPGGSGVGGSGGGWNNLPANLPRGGLPSGPFFTTPRIMGAYFGYEGMKSIFEATAQKDALLAGLMTQGFTPEQARQAYLSAIDVQQNMPGSGVLGNLGLVSKLMTVLQKPEEALADMPALARLGVILNANGLAGQGDVMMSAIRAGELRGVLSSIDPKTGADVIDAGALLKFVNELAAVSVVSHGQIGPAQMLQYIKSGGISALMEDDQSLFAGSMALQMAMGSANAGTALQGFGMQFSSGRMSQAAVNLLTQAGIIHDPSKVLKAGMGYYILMPGAMSTSDVQMGRDKPEQFITSVLLPGIQGWLHKQYGAAYDTADPAHQRQMEEAAAQTFASRIPGGKEIAQVMQQILLIGRDKAAVIAELGRDPLAIQMANNPQLRMAALTEAFKAFETAMGDNMMGTAISSLNSLTATLNHLGDFARNHPMLMGMLVGAGIGGAITKTPQGIVGGGILGFGTYLWGLDPFGKSAGEGSPGDPNGGGLFHPQSYAPGGSAGGVIQLRGDVNLDGRKVGDFMAASLTSGLSGPSSGPAVPDLRSSPYASHGMASA